MEENENKFVSLFTDRFDLRYATIYANKIMNNDPFFNRLVDIKTKDLDYIIDDAEQVFKSINVKPFIHCMDDQLRIVLEKHGYTVYDRLSVLLFESPYRVKGVTGIKIEKGNIEAWIDTYCIAFDSIDYKDEIRKRVTNAKDLELYTASMKDCIVGCMALLASRELLGLYCLGVLPEFRRLGIASSLIRYAYEIAYKRGLQLFLQTFLSENLVRYYIKHGFTQMYVKSIYSKPL